MKNTILKVYKDFYCNHKHKQCFLNEKPWLIESLTNYCMWLFKIILYICEDII